MSAPILAAVATIQTASVAAAAASISVFRLHYQTLAGAEGSTLITAANPSAARAAFKATHRDGPTALIRKIKLDRSKELV